MPTFTTLSASIMLGKLVRFIFFGNYFVGLLAVVLSVETVIQLRLPFNAPAYYALLFCGTVMYYTYAYTGALLSANSQNPRSAWYGQHRQLVKLSQLFFVTACAVLGIFLLYNYFTNLQMLPWYYWLVVFAIGAAAVLYYGLLPRAFIGLNLRNTGWLKAFVIGFEWAACVSLLPLVILYLERSHYAFDHFLALRLFIKNWMFCTVNAIMFDMKDYEDDSNKQLKTFVVRFGLRKTILFVLTPLCLIGTFFTVAFGIYRHFTSLPIVLNVIPFALMLLVTYSMQKQKNIFFYLIVIDGLVLLKALCGIAGMAFVAGH